ncbi:MAG TPA: riboflavin synthase subunit alpha, partial [Candidatus Poseidoniia archaeon]|nr:riboflavin synthase subunit alpha [Candidatus Poseidoniia archaeon]
QGVFEVAAVRRAPDLLSYDLSLDENLLAGLALGASVSIDGVCQTVAAIEGGRISFDAIRETLDRTTLGELEAGSRVSVERSLRVGDEIGGHDVSGHVLGTGVIEEAHHRGHVSDLRISIPSSWMKYILEKGFIAVNGSSLTVAEVDSSGLFSVHLIPETVRLTALADKEAGSRVNIELDTRTVAIVDTVERVMAERSGDPTPPR